MGVFSLVLGVEPEVWAIDLDTGEREFLIAGLTPRYASTGHLLFGTPEGVLMAAPFDPRTAELTGLPVPVAEDLAIDPTAGVSYCGVGERDTSLSSRWCGRRGPGEFPGSLGDALG